MTKYRSVDRIIWMSVHLICTGIAAEAAAAQPAYTVTDLGTLLDATWGYSTGLDINASGQVTGFANTTGNTDGAFLWTPTTPNGDSGTINDLGTLGGPSSYGSGINASGQVTGYSYTTGNEYHAFLYDGTHHDLGTLGGTSSYGYGINHSGQVTGYSTLLGGQYYETRAFVWTEDGGMQNLGTLGGASSVAYGINDIGHVTGGSETVEGESHAMLYDGTMHDLGTLGGGYSYGNRVSDSGRVTGVSSTTDGEYHAFLWTPGMPNGDSGTMYDLGTLGGSYSGGFGISASSQVLGGSYTTDDASYHAFLYASNTGMVDLNALIDPDSGWVLSMRRGNQRRRTDHGIRSAQRRIQSRVFVDSPPCARAARHGDLGRLPTGLILRNSRYLRTPQEGRIT